MKSRARATADADCLRTVKLQSHLEYVTYCRSHTIELEHQRRVERELASSHQTFSVPGRCAVCARDVAFQVSYAFAYEVDGILTPNWREHLRCPECGLTNRSRATVSLMASLLRATPTSSIYMTEQLTPLFSWMERRYSSVEGSEFLGDQLPLGALNEAGVRNEDVTRLTFRDRTFDWIISLDVLEHVPNYLVALEELLRVLKPGGRLLLSVPFRTDLDGNVVRARLGPGGEIEHLEPPEYHGDPICSDGCLAFYHFGWELLRQISDAGFDDACGVLYWSRELGHLGRDQILFLARRPPLGAVARGLSRLRAGRRGRAGLSALLRRFFSSSGVTELPMVRLSQW